MPSLATVFFGLLKAVIIALFIGCNPPPVKDSGQADHHHQSTADAARGPHGGRLFTSGAFSLELQIFESGVPPQYRVYGFENSTPLPPTAFSATVTLHRLGGRTDNFSFTPVGDFLTSTKEVQEPHSFEVEMFAEYKGEKYKWHFAAYEGRTVIADDVADRSGIKTATAGPRTIKTLLRTRGKILPSEHRIAHIIPRFSGLVREGRKHIGDRVEKGEVLAVIESNESLQPFEIKSQIAGTVINGHLIVGEFVPENQWVYIVADLSELWVDFFVPLRSIPMVKVGQKVHISSVNSENQIQGTVSYVAPYADVKSQSQLLRTVIPNKGGEFLPGMFVIGDLVVQEDTAAVVVNRDALARFRNWNVVFIKVGNIYEIKPVEVGRSEGDFVEIVSGLSAGEEYVAQNAFLIKADILKSGASHDH